MKNATRKLIPALAMLLISAVLMSTASFAWFSMNKTVTATGMTVTAKADQTFLVISSTANNPGTAVSATASNAAAELFPAAYGGIAAGTVTWKTGYSNNINSSVNVGELTDVHTNDVNKYVLSNTFYIRAASGTVNATNLKLTGVTVTGTSIFKDAVSVVVAVGDEVNQFNKTQFTDNNNLSNATPLAATVTSNADVIVNVYIYIDGNHQNVKTINAIDAANLTGMSVELVFGVA